jgi:uncharacterized membrane protein HdeD (DUF308 family)
VHALASRWWMQEVRGVAALVFGILAMTLLGSSPRSLVVLFGIYAAVDAVANLALAVRRGGEGTSWVSLELQGAVGLAASAVALAWTGLSPMAFLMLVAGWALLTGGAQIAAAVLLRREIVDEWIFAAGAAFTVAFGVHLVMLPVLGAQTMVWSTGAYGLVFGLLLLRLGFRLRRFDRTSDWPFGELGGTSPGA